ncbi:hypothetical protein [Pedobacter sp.]|uniref:hypothetical protein n=1 Tax=Pedobacter sp. TaxID=1411316 RepID=UPI00396CC53A
MGQKNKRQEGNLFDINSLRKSSLYRFFGKLVQTLLGRNTRICTAARKNAKTRCGLSLY